MAATLGRGRLRLDGGYGRRAFGAADFYGAFPSYETTATTSASACFDAIATAPGQLAMVVHGRRHTDHFVLRRSDPAFYENRHTSLQSGGEITTRVASADGRAAAVVGAEFLDARLASARLGDRDEQRYALFTESRIAPAARLGLIAGLRLDHRPGEESFVSPSLAATVSLTQAVQARASVDRGFRNPTWTERYYRDPANIGSADLRPERFWSGELGLRATGARHSADVAVFARNARDLIDWARPFGAASSTPWRTLNVERAEIVGVEGEAATPLGREAGSCSWPADRPSRPRAKARTSANMPAAAHAHGRCAPRARRSGRDHRDHRRAPRAPCGGSGTRNPRPAHRAGRGRLARGRRCPEPHRCVLPRRCGQAGRGTCRLPRPRAAPVT